MGVSGKQYPGMQTVSVRGSSLAIGMETNAMPETKRFFGGGEVMSYSRWGASRWYTFWACQDGATEDRDTAIFECCPVPTFTAAELRANIEKCLDAACDEEERKDSVPDISDDDREELRGYMSEFLAEVDQAYPEGMMVK